MQNKCIYFIPITLLILEFIFLNATQCQIKKSNDVQAATKMAIGFSSTIDSNIPLGHSKIGGFPHLPSSIKYPTNDSKKLSFLIQINLSEIRQLDQEKLLPEKGILYFFYDDEKQPWGFDPKDVGGWKVVFFDGDVSLLELPKINNLSERTFKECSLNFYNYSTDSPQLPKSDIDSLKVLHHLIGYPQEIQGDTQLECQLVTNGLYSGNSSGYNNPEALKLKKTKDEWILLLQIDSDDNANMMWGDNGRLYFYIKKTDLNKHNFDNCWVILQCY